MNTFRELYKQNMTSIDNKPHLLRCLSKLKNPKGLEVGCFEGGSTKFFLDNGVHSIDVVDPFTGNPEHGDVVGLEDRFFANMVNYRDRFMAYPKKSQIMLPLLLHQNRRYDFIYIDGSHDGCDVIRDCIYGFELLRPGGIMVMDDYQWWYYDDPYKNPGIAIDFFLNAKSSELEVLEKNYQVSIQKK